MYLTKMMKIVYLKEVDFLFASLEVYLYFAPNQFYLTLETFRDLSPKL